ncbi:MAG: hypothetical protein KAT79_03260 [candidate division Zixibacteria bacterium]|nr:hypothetical protein [candidate division Zixibacteria bacterium]
MARRLLVSLVALALILIQCSDDSVNPINPYQAPQQTPPVPGYGTLFEIEEGNSAVIESDSLEIGFARVVADSRCPANVVCIWQGEATIELWIDGPGFDLTTISVSIEGLIGNLRTPNDRSVDTLGYLITLVNLDPYPKIPDHPGDPKPGPNVARLLVLKKSEQGSIGIVAINNAPPEQLTGDQYTLKQVGWDDDGSLVITVSYGGGCGNHYWQLYMSPSSFFESFPVQANLYLYHYDDDPCKALVTTTVRFDISPITDLYFEMYDREDPIILNIYDYFDDVPSSRKRVTYFP